MPGAHSSLPCFAYSPPCDRGPAPSNRARSRAAVSTSRRSGRSLNTAQLSRRHAGLPERRRSIQNPELRTSKLRFCQALVLGLDRSLSAVWRRASFAGGRAASSTLARTDPPLLTRMNPATCCCMHASRVAVSHWALTGCAASTRASGIVRAREHLSPKRSNLCNRAIRPSGAGWTHRRAPSTSDSEQGGPAFLPLAINVGPVGRNRRRWRGAGGLAAGSRPTHRDGGSHSRPWECRRSRGFILKGTTGSVLASAEPPPPPRVIVEVRATTSTHDTAPRPHLGAGTLGESGGCGEPSRIASARRGGKCRGPGPRSGPCRDSPNRCRGARPLFRYRRGRSPRPRSRRVPPGPQARQRAARAWFRRHSYAFDTSSAVHSRSPSRSTPDGVFPTFSRIAHHHGH